MQAQRKFDEPQAAASTDAATVGPASVDRMFGTHGAELRAAPSPARLLREELAARLEASGACATIDCSPHASDVVKWPMAYRLTLIVGVSVALWAALIAGGMQVLSR